MDLLLGLDVGTTATKALLFDLKGNVIASASYGYGLITACEGWVEQDPEEFWRGVVETCRSVAAQIDPSDRVAALSLSSQAGTTIPTGADGQPAHNAFSWMDQRAGEQARRVEQRWGAEFIHRATGWHLSDGLPLNHIPWLRENLPGVFAATRHFFFVNDFIARRLTGQLCMNPSDAGITQLMGLAAGNWDDRLLDAAGITRAQLSPMRPSGQPIGTLTAGASAATGLPRDVLVVNGAHDQYCAAVGAGVTQPGQVLLSCGTAWVILAVPENRTVGLGSGMAISHHAIAGRWGALRSLGGVGTSLEWLLDNVWGGREAGERHGGLYEAINAGAARTIPGASGLLFFPLAGGHAQSIGTGRGGFVGLALSHSRDDMARAVMEGIACELRWAIGEMRGAGMGVSDLKMVGGAAGSQVWPQIVADVTAVPVTLPAFRQAAARGAAILAGVGAGLFADPEGGFRLFKGEETRLEPNAEYRQQYDDQFHRYQTIFQLLGRELSATGT